MQNTNRETTSTITADTNLVIEEKAGLNTEYSTPLDKAASAATKRVFDIVFSSVFLVCLFPFVYMALGIAIKLSSPGAVLFMQKRTGKGGKIFRCYKFRSMRINPDGKPATTDDPRITRIGRFIRRTNLDELPQFINVLKGDMSVVGPRPHALWTDEEYAPLIEDYMLRYTVKPGVTGWAQVGGFRGEIKQTDDMEGRIARDLWYIRNRTFSLDISIILRTLVSMIRGDKNAY
jgi:putative colanic acid biosynthesis UDP-glucose lipid carrier transferase